MHPRIGMGPLLSLGKRPGPTNAALPPSGPRPSLLGFPVARRMLTIETTSNSGATGDRTTLYPWRFR